MRWRRRKTLATPRWGTRPPCRQNTRQGTAISGPQEWQQATAAPPATKGFSQKSAACTGRKYVLAACQFRLRKFHGDQTTFSDTHHPHRVGRRPAAVPPAAGKERTTDEPLENGGTTGNQQGTVWFSTTCNIAKPSRKPVFESRKRPVKHHLHPSRATRLPSRVRSPATPSLCCFLSPISFKERIMKRRRDPNEAGEKPGP